MGFSNTTPVLALALDAAVLGTDPSDWLNAVSAAEGAGLDLVTIADSHRGVTARIDAALLAAWLGARTSQIGLVPEINTTISEPFLVASQIATLDFISGGRAGWLAQVSAEAADGGYVGPRAVAVGDAGWAEAAEFAEVLVRLWDSWEDDAEIRDLARHRFIDAERVHYIDFEGEHLSIKGPSITPRPPQGRPPLAVTVRDDPWGAALAGGADAELVFLDEGRGGQLAAVRAAAPDARVLVDVGLEAPIVDPQALVAIASERGFDGVRLIPGTPEVEFVPAWNGRPAPTLRERLGFTRPQSRYAEARR